MGCSNSKVKGEGKEEKKPIEIESLNSTTGSLTSTKRAELWESILGTLLHDAETFISQLDENDSLKLTQMKIFLNSLVEVLRQTVRLKFDASRDAIRTVATRVPQLALVIKALPDVEERVVDDGYSRLLTTWMTRTNNAATACEAVIGALRSVEMFLQDSDLDAIRRATNSLDPLAQGGFICVLQHYTKMALSNASVNEIFAKNSSNKECLTVNEFCAFIRENQAQDAISERAALDKIRNRFGGHVTKLNFGSYLNGLITNSALDPQRAATVWQDMTQPLPHYMVSTARILDEDSLHKAIHDGVRSFVLACKQEHGDVYSGTVLVRTVLEEIKAHGFTENAFPIVICFAPDQPMSVHLQDRVAAIVTETLGPMLAKGIMFEGAILSDPSFSPAALQNKVLIMGSQAPLKPFVGFLVADMNRDGLGVRVTDVKSSTPASKAGILKDDWLTHINGQPILNKQHLREHLAGLRLGDEFTMRKENLDEVRVIVGGAVTDSDANNSMSLSNLVFLKILSKNGGADHKFPWETSAMMSDELDFAAQSREELGDHFMFVSPVRNSNPDYVGLATLNGAQFVEAGADTESHIWSRGLFSENAHCGYILKSETETTSPMEATIAILAPPPHLEGSTLTQLSVRTHGPVHGFADNDTRTVRFTDYGGTSVGVVVVEWLKDGQTYEVTSSFPLLLLRGGYRVLPGLMTVDELSHSPSTVGTFCKITIQPREL